MFKRILTFVAAAAAAVTISSCQKDDKPTVEFEKSLYTAYAKRSVDVKVILSEPATENVSVMINSSGANAGTDFELTGVPVTIKAGETSGTFSVKNLNLTQASPLNLGIECPSGYDLGTKFVTIVAPDPEETLVYSFELTKADVLGSYVAKIKVTGVTSGDKLSLNDDVIIPLKITGEAAPYVVFGHQRHVQTLFRSSRRPQGRQVDSHVQVLPQGRLQGRGQGWGDCGHGRSREVHPG